MSLNGLDSEAVSAAYQSTIAEPAGWFLLKYITRDEVDVLGTGKAGFSEARETITKYEEESPLFGLVLYKRKRALLKYVPEGTSRLLQARLAVHLQSVIEKFPHDGVVSIVTAVELHETVLATALATLKSSGSIKSPGAKPQRPLTEILEDASESSQKKSVNGEAEQKKVEEGPAKVHLAETKVLAPISQGLPLSGPGDKQNRNSLETELTVPLPKESLEHDSNDLRTSFETRPSVSLTRAATYESDVSWAYKPKVKLGPRPSLETGEQPRSSGTFMRNTARLPANLRITSPRVPASSERPQTSKTPSKPFFEDMGRFSSQLSGGSPRPPSRSGSVVTVPAYTEYPETLSPVSPTAPAITPEKQRLMKALQQRKKHQLARKTAEEAAAKEAQDTPTEKTGVEQASSSERHTTERSNESSAEPPASSQPDAEDHEHSNDQTGEKVTGSSETAEPIAVTNTERDFSLPKRDEVVSTEQADSHAVAETRHRTDVPISAPILDNQNLFHEPLESNVEELATATADSSVLSEREEEKSYATSKDIPIDSAVNELAGNEASLASGAILEQSQESAAMNHVTRTPLLQTEEPQLPYEQSLVPSAEYTISRNVRSVDENTINGFSETAQEVEPIKILMAESTTAQVAPSVGAPPPETAPRSQEVASTAVEAPLTAVEEPDILPIQGDAHPTSSFAQESSAVETDVTPTEITHKAASNSVSTTKSQNDSEANADAASPATEVSSTTPTDQDRLTVKLSELKHKSVSSAASDESSPKTRPPPIEISKHDSSDVTSLDGDALYEELQSATVEKATPMVVARSPATPIFPIEVRPSSRREIEGGPQLISIPPTSQPINGSPEKTIGSKLVNTVTPPSPSTRSEIQGTQSSSGDLPIPDRIAVGKTRAFTEVRRTPSHSPGLSREPPGSPPARKTSGVGSLISQRIKAFEKFGSSSSKHQAASTAVITPSIVSRRKASLSTPPSSSGVESTTGGRLEGRVYPTPSPSPHGNVVLRTLSSRNITSSGSNSRLNADNISTATTVIPRQDLLAKKVELATSSASASKKSSAASTPSEPAIQQPIASYFSTRARKKSKSNSISSVSSSVKESIRESLSSPSRTSFSSKRSSRQSSDTVRQTDLSSGPKSPASESGRSSDGTDGGSESGKKPSRRSRLLQRMSSIALSPRRNIAHALSPTALNDQPIAEGKEPEGKRWTATKVGDVNVQFPDTLLWKRRHLQLDSHGYIILEPARMDSMGSRTVAVKRYHLSEFCAPYLPDQDREELPHSVILDFMDASTLQFAAENTAAQAGVLQVLLHAHHTFASRR